MNSDSTIPSRLAQFLYSHPARSAGASRDVQDLLRRIHTELFDPGLSVKTLRARCRVGDHNISCRFRQELGVTIRDYIESLRLEAARTLVEESDCAVADAGRAVGYAHLQTFYGAFVRRFGCTPGALRRLARTRESTRGAVGA